MLECDELYEFAVNVYLDSNPNLASKYNIFYSFLLKDYSFSTLSPCNSHNLSHNHIDLNSSTFLFSLLEVQRNNKICSAEIWNKWW
jgi:hypothetical protein